jgi:hypothetical protein
MHTPLQRSRPLSGTHMAHREESGWGRTLQGSRLWTFVLERSEGSGWKLLPLCCPHGSFIDVQTEARGFWQRDVSLDRPKNVGTQALAEFLEWEEVFGDYEIWHTGRSVNSG